MHNKAEAYAHEVEMDIYIKKIEQTALEEKHRLMKQGKPTFSKTLIDEVVQLREENESGRQKLFVLQQKMIDIQKLIENGMNSGGRNGNYLEYLHQMITQVVGDIPTLHQSLLECDKLHPHFSGELMKITPTISGMEMKVAKLIRLGFSTQSIALTCGVTIKSIENHRMKLRKKIMLKQAQSLSAFLTSL
jgi:DNA-binding NarL/FixJ family response regulator